MVYNFSVKLRKSAEIRSFIIIIIIVEDDGRYTRKINPLIVFANTIDSVTIRRKDSMSDLGFL